MKRLALTLFVVHALACLSTAQVAENQWRFSKRNANGTYTDYGLTAVNGQAIGFTGGVPSMLSIAGGAWGSITGTLSSQIDLQTALDAKLATSTAASTYQPLDSDLTAIAALTTTSFGRELLTRADAAATRSALGLGTLATQSATISDYLTLATAASTYQPLASRLTSIANLADAAGVLTNNGSGTFSYTATSTGGNTLGLDAGKIAVYGSNGELKAASALRLTAGPSVMGIFFNDGGSVPGRLTSDTSGFGSRLWTLPNVSGTLITTGDTGTVTNAMLAGSIAISKLAITGTPDGTKYLRDDGTWQTVSSGATLGANTFTALQTVNLTALGTTPSSGATLTNTTAAAAGSQQVSPSLTWAGQGWKTNATAASQQTEFRANVLPVQGAANPTAIWQLQKSINGEAFANILTASATNASGDTALVIGSTTAATTITTAVGLYTTFSISGGSFRFVEGGVVAQNMAFNRFSLGSGIAFEWSSTTAATGTGDLILSRIGVGILGIEGSSTGGAIQLREMTAPSAPAADRARLWIEDNGSGKTRLMIQFGSGTAQQIAIEP